MERATIIKIISALTGPLVSLSVLLLSAVVIEGWCRSRDPFANLPPDGWIDGVRYTWGHEAQFNSFGFREREIQSPKSPSLYRVMILGDSYSWGSGLPIDAAFPRVAERLLNSNATGSRRFQILNFSTPGDNTVKERNILRQYAKLVNPDRIAIGFCFNDLDLGLHESAIEQSRKSFADKHEWLFSFGRGLSRFGMRATGQLFTTAVNRWGENWKLQLGWLDAIERSYLRDGEELRAFRAALSDIRAISDSLSLVPPLFAVLNQGDSMSAATDYLNPSPLLKRFISWWDQAKVEAQAAGFVVYDHVNEISRDLKGQYLGLNGVDWHPSAELNRVYGEKLYKVIAQTVLTDD